MAKRRDPRKAADEREEFRRSASSAPSDGTAAVPRSNKKSTLTLVEEVIKGKIAQRKRRSMGYGPPPQVPGAMQYGFRKPRGDA